MADGRNYFIFHKEMDYQRGDKHGLIFEHGCLRPLGNEPGHFLSRLLDSREKEMVWHRLRFCYSEGEEHIWSMRLYCSEKRMICCGDEYLDIDELTRSGQFSLKQKMDWMEPFCVRVIQGQEDVLLHEVKGRYLWFCVQSEAEESGLQGIRQIRLDFPRKSWLPYLPEVYQGEGKSPWFLERYLAIYQSIYEDMTEAIEQIVWRFDPDCADSEFLSWIAQWMALDDAQTWNQEQLRYLVKNAMHLYRIRGSGAYLKTMIRLYTGYEPYLVEYHQISTQKNIEASEHLRELYGGDAYTFTLLVNTGGQNGKREYQTLVQIAEHAVPAHMKCKVVVLQQYIFLDQYSYLGVNSRLSQYRPLQLDGLSAMHFTRIGS